MGLIGDIAGLFAGNGDEDRAKQLWEQLNPEAGPAATFDPAGRNAQVDTLSALKSIAAGNLQPMDRVRQQQAMDASNRNEQGQRGAIVQNAAARGMGGSGTELAAQLAAEQGGANRTAAAGSQAASDANQRALQAIAQGGSQAGALRGQDIQSANEADAMSRFNAGQRLGKVAGETGQLKGWSDTNQARWTGLGNDVGDAIGANKKTGDLMSMLGF